jgi:hypothetical protein
MHSENAIDSAQKKDEQTVRKTWSTPTMEVHDVEDLTLAAANANPDAGNGSS